MPPPPTPESDRFDRARFLVWRNGNLGNTVVAIPFILALRRAFPRGRLAVVVDRAGRDLLSAFPGIDDLIVYERRHGQAALAGSARLVARLRANRFTHSFHLRRARRNVWLARLAGIRNRLGFDRGSGAGLLTQTVPYLEDRNIVLTCLSLLSLVGRPLPDPVAYEYPVGEDAAAAAAALIGACGAAGRPYALVHGGAVTQSAHRLSPGAMIAILRELAARLSVVPVLLKGPDDEQAVADVLAASGNEPPGVCDVRAHSVRVTIELMRRASLFVGQDSGPAHLAALVGTPEVVFYAERGHLPAHLAKWRPWQPRCAVCVVPEDAPAGRVLGELGRALDGLQRGSRSADLA